MGDEEASLNSSRWMYSWLRSNSVGGVVVVGANRSRRPVIVSWPRVMWKRDPVRMGDLKWRTLWREMMAA